MAERLMEDDAQNVVRAVIAAAKNGDMVAARLVLDRVLPARRGRPVQFTMPELEKVADLPRVIGAIIKRIAGGELTPDEAASIAAVLETQRRAIELTEIEARLRALEERAADEVSA